MNFQKNYSVLQLTGALVKNEIGEHFPTHFFVHSTLTFNKKRVSLNQDTRLRELRIQIT